MNWKYTVLLLGLLALATPSLGQARKERESEPPGNLIDIDTEFEKEREEIPEGSGSGLNSDEEDDEDDLEKSSGSGSGSYGTDVEEKTTTTTSKPLTPCENLREASKHLLGNYVPRCTSNGDYAAMQCRGYPGTGKCWCSDTNGAEIPGTAMGPPKTPDCETGSNLSPCVYKFVQHVRNPMYGSFRPRCKVNGDFDELQCHGSQCFCVDINGKRIFGTTVQIQSNFDSDMCITKSTESVLIIPEEGVTVKYTVSSGKSNDIDVEVSGKSDDNDSEEKHGKEDDEDDDDGETNKTGVENEDPKKEHTQMASTYIMATPGLLAAIIGGAVVGLLCAILLVMFIVYRMRKKDEGSYALDEPRKKSAYSPINTTEKEFYA